MKTHQTSTQPDAAALQAAPPKVLAGPTVKGRGIISYRSAAARDLAAILDLDTAVRSWSCCQEFLGAADRGHVPDFRMIDSVGTICFLDAPDRDHSLEIELEEAARQGGASYRVVQRDDIYSGFRLRNARDLLRYANYTVSLADRIRLLATLDDQGSLPMADCLSVIRGGEPVAAIASLMLHGFLEAELDDTPLGPETMVRRIRR
jgi:hypothetical protein